MRDLLIYEMRDELDHGSAHRLVVALVTPTELHHHPLDDSLPVFWQLCIDYGRQRGMNLLKI